MPVGRHTVYRSNAVNVDFELDRDGIAQCAMGPELKAAVRAIADKGQAFAISISPVSDEHEEGHVHYIESFVIDETSVVLPKEWPMRRVCARLWNIAPHAAAVEWGTQRNPDGYYVLTNTVERLERF